MKPKRQRKTLQPKPRTLGLTKDLVRRHAQRIFRDKLPDHNLTLAEWQLAEKDLLQWLEAKGR